MEEDKIPPKAEWYAMSSQQLMDVRLKLQDRYYSLRRINASFADQFARFISEIETLISRKMAEEAEATDQ